MTFGRAAAALLCGALVALSGCGGGKKGDPIPAAQADRMISAIQAADQYNSQGRCERAHTKVRDARFLLGQVPSTVDSSVTQGISNGLTHLDQLISQECQQQKPTQTQTTPSQTETTQTQTSQTTTTPSTTTPTQTTLTTTTPTTTTPTTTTPTTTTPTTTGGGNGGTPTSGGAGNQG